MRAVGFARRDVERYQSEVYTFASASDFINHGFHHKPGIQSIFEGGSVIDLMHAPKGSNTTIVMFHAALSTANVSLPIFAGGSLAGHPRPNMIFVADPTLYADDQLKIGWYAGSTTLKLQVVLPRVIKRLLADCATERVIFMGASAGGFAALYYSHIFPGSLAIPINPQTNIAEFGKVQQRDFTRACFGAVDDATHYEVLRNEIYSDLRDLYSSEVPNHVLYLQNRSDDHVALHLEPFLAALADHSRLRMRWGNWGKGHVAPPKEELQEIVNSIVRTQGDWETALPTIEVWINR